MLIAISNRLNTKSYNIIGTITIDMYKILGIYLFLDLLINRFLLFKHLHGYRLTLNQHYNIVKVNKMSVRLPRSNVGPRTKYFCEPYTEL